MFTRLSNFTYGNYKIAGIDATTLDSNVEMQIHIQKFEEQGLRLLLGDTIYTQLMTKVELDGKYWKIKTANANTVWDWLLNGKTYTADETEASVCGCGCHSNDTNRVWKGLVKKVATVQEKDVYESIMAPYLFFYYSLNSRTLNLGIGEGRLDAKNVIPESSKNKRVDAWNDFVQWASFGYSCTNVSLFQLLNHYKEDFPEWNPIIMNTMNYYDL